MRRSLLRLRPSMTTTVSSRLFRSTTVTNLSFFERHLHVRLHRGGRRLGPLSPVSLNVRRSLAFSHVSQASLASQPPAEPTILVAYPQGHSAIQEPSEDEDESDVELVPPEEARIEITERAAEVASQFIVLSRVSRH